MRQTPRADCQLNLGWDITHLFELEPGEVVFGLVGSILPECWLQISDSIVHGLNGNNGNTHYVFQLGQCGREGGRERGREGRDNVCSRIYIGIFLLTDWHQWSGPVIIKTIIVSLIDHSQSFHHHAGINSNCYFCHHHHHVSSCWKVGIQLCCYNTYFNKTVCVSVVTQPATEVLPAVLLVN